MENETKKGRKPIGSMSYMDALIKVLSESSEPLTCKQIVDQMKIKGYWVSPKGKLPHQTIAAGLQRNKSMFVKTSRGKWILNKSKEQ